MRMQDKKLKRFGVYANIANVIFVIIIVVGVLLTVGGAFVTMLIGASTIDITKVTNLVIERGLPGAQLILPDKISLSCGVLYALILNMAIGFALAAYVVKMLVNMFKYTVKEKTPFTQKTVRCIKRIGATFIIYAGVIFVMSLVTGAIAPEPTLNLNVSFRWILIGLLVCVLGEMFEYGASLRPDSGSIL